MGVGANVEGKPRASHKTMSDAVAESGIYSILETAGGVSSLFFNAVRQMLKPPFPWVRESIVEASTIMRRCLVPLAVAITVFMVGFGFFVLGGITKILGASDREAGAVIIGFLREANVWITGMIFAGVAGSAMTADLGARKVREELDAMSVLGLDLTKTLVVPKLVAGVVICPILGYFSLLIVEIVNFSLAPEAFGFTRGVMVESTKGSLLSLDVLGAFIRYVIIGALVAVVACYKGLNAGGGTEGVGKAVNQTIVLTFFAIWMLDAFFNLGYLSLFPQAQASFKG